MSRLPMTFERYAMIMHINPCAFQGIVFDVGCSAMSCQERSALSGDIKFAISKINDALGQDELNLSDVEIELGKSAPYWIARSGIELRQFVSQEADAAVSYSTGDECSKTATVEIQLSLADCEIFEGATVIGGLNKCSNYPFDWEVTRGENGVILTTMGYNLANVTDNNVATYPTEVRLLVSTSIPSKIYGQYHEICKCGTCGTCNGVTELELCYQEVDGVVRFSGNNSCICVGEPIGYRFKAIRRGVSDESLDDAIVSLANYRQAIKKCTNCSYEAQSRLNRDLGITEKGEDMRVKSPAWAFNNGFGIQTPGALAAWKAVTLKFGISGYAGHA